MIIKRVRLLDLGEMKEMPKMAGIKLNLFKPLGLDGWMYDPWVLRKKQLLCSQRVSRQREFHFYQKANWLSKC